MSELLIDTRIEAMPRPRLRGAARARRCSTLRFTLWMVPWFALVAIGLFAAVQCLVGGLHHTNMDNRYPFGLWIFLDLTVIALGAGAFTTGLLAYVFRWREVRAVLHLAVLTGLICYGGAIAILLIDVGQPLRAWFTFWHPNVHSMLAEVTFCLTCYLLVLAVEAIPVLARNRKWRRNDLVAAFGSRVHHGMVVLAVLGATLSFFHQGSLGGLYGVLQGRPFAYREVLWIFPTTFFLFVLSAMAVGPSFLLLVTRACEAVARRPLVPGAVLERLARLSGSLLMVYLLLKAVDTLVWLNRTVPAAGEHPCASLRRSALRLMGARAAVRRFRSGAGGAVAARGEDPARNPHPRSGARVRGHRRRSARGHAADALRPDPALRADLAVLAELAGGDGLPGRDRSRSDRALARAPRGDPLPGRARARPDHRPEVRTTCSPTPTSSRGTPIAWCSSPSSCARRWS
jgi:hypothetical protein